jgi:hypothetical protein
MKAEEVQMAKKAGNINMAEEIRNLLTQDSELTRSEVEAMLRKKFPRQKDQSKQLRSRILYRQNKTRIASATNNANLFRRDGCGPVDYRERICRQM